VDLLVTADDRTGALETAAALARDGAGLVPVLTRLGDVARAGARAAVVDIATRHLAADRAATRAIGVDDIGAARHAHKIDSTLRGSWASELVARHTTTGRPVLVVPAYPALGRTCVRGVVLEDGVPVHEGAAGLDVRFPISDSRPAEMLRGAGALDVVGCHDLIDLVDWLEVPGGIAVADASSDSDLAAIANRWVGVEHVLLAGTSAAIGAAGARLFEGADPHDPPPVRGPVLAVCGSAHPRAFEQVERAEQRGARVFREQYDHAVDALADGRPVVLALEPPEERPLEPATTTVARLAAAADAVLSAHDVGALVVIGGDTAAAVLGPEPVLVGGMFDDGAAWGHRPGGDRPLIVSRAGGFGGPDSLVDLLWGALGQ
jgi:4-hydroxythreonine-4-phosphate dehydrogenase